MDNKDENQNKTEVTNKFKTDLIRNLVEKNNSQIKENNAICLMDILSKIESLSSQDIKAVCEDINKNNIRCGIDEKSIKYISEHNENQNIKDLLKNLDQPLNIDVNSIAELSTKEFSIIRNLCKIDKVYVNSGWDEAAKLGYSADKYEKIRANADKMIDKAFKNLSPNASEKEKFMALYNMVIKAEKYDYQALDTNKAKDKSSCFYTSRNLEGFFLKNGRSVCSGTADALKNLCECAGLQVEYVQGMAQSKHQKESEYHAWIKVNIDGKWYNADPTWDANKAGEPYEYCLKSDNEFKGHQEDKTYNPTYKRGTNIQISYTKTRTYNKAEESMSRENIKLYCDNNILDKKKFTPENKRYVLTEQDKLYYNQNQIPANTYAMTASKTWIDRIIEFFAKIFGGNINLGSNKKNINKFKNIAKETGPEKQGLNIPLITPEQANSYIEKMKENANKSSISQDKDDQEQNR